MNTTPRQSPQLVGPSASFASSSSDQKRSNELQQALNAQRVSIGRVQLKCDGTRWRKGGEVKGKLANGVVVSTLHTTSEHGVSSITTADAHTSTASSRLNWRPRRFKWTRPFRWKTKSGFCACAITFQTCSTTVPSSAEEGLQNTPVKRLKVTTPPLDYLPVG